MMWAIQDLITHFWLHQNLDMRSSVRIKLVKYYNCIKDNDSSVLENYHSSALFQILVNPKSDVTANLTEKEFRLFRKLCIGMILDTGSSKIN